MKSETGILATPEETAEIGVLVKLEVEAPSGHEADVALERQIARMDEIASAHGLPKLPAGHHYYVRSDGMLIS